MSSAEDIDEKFPHMVEENADIDDADETREIHLSMQNSSVENLLAKRKASPFTSTMDVALATAYTTERSILDGTQREQGVPTRQQKLEAWERIRDCVNAFSGDGNQKTVQQCKDRHRNLIQAVRFKRSSGFMEGPLPLPYNSHSEEQMEQETSPNRQNPETNSERQQAQTTESANGFSSMSTSSQSSLKDKRPVKRPAPPSLLPAIDTVEEYRKRKMAILMKEHIVRVELMKAQTEYYRTKTDLMVKHSCSRPTIFQPKLPSHLHPSGNT